MISVIRRWAGSGGRRGVGDATQTTRPAVQAAWSRRASRTSLGRSARVRVVQRQRPEYHGFRAGGCRSRRMKAPQRWIGFPCVRGSLKRFVHRGPCGANLKHRARDAGDPALPWWLCSCDQTQSTSHEAAGSLDPGVPRALVSAGRWKARPPKPQGEGGNANVDDGLPGAAKNTGGGALACAATRAYFFTLPLVGRVAPLEARSRVGVIIECESFDPHPARCASASRATLPTRGRVRKQGRCLTIASESRSDRRAKLPSPCPKKIVR